MCGDESGGAPSPDGGGGAGVGGAGGTGGAGGAGDPCAPHDGATAVVTACQDGVTLYCQLGETEPCNPGYVCVEWVDPSTHVLDAYCAMEGETDICDPDYDSSSCQGNVAHECIGVAGPNDPPTAPGHYQDFDCVALYGAESVCMVDDVTAHPTCTMP